MTGLSGTVGCLGTFSVVTGGCSGGDEGPPCGVTGGGAAGVAGAGGVCCPVGGVGCSGWGWGFGFSPLPSSSSSRLSPLCLLLSLSPCCGVGAGSFCQAMAFAAVS